MASSSISSAAAAASSTAATKTINLGSKFKIVGIVLAITSGVLIGSSFVFKKKGLLRSQAGHTAGEGVAYLKSPLWWLGMIMMILGEICNFAAYAFVEAVVVTPLGALSVVICAILSSIFLKEKLTFFGWLGCGLCILGSVIIALNGPQEAAVGQILAFQKLFISPGFLVYISILIIASLVIIFYFAPKYGRRSMLWYISVCSMIGGISVSVTTGLGAAIVQTAFGDNQFKHWFMYFLLAFVIITLLTEVYYLNVALALFNTAMVTPTYYVIFTFFSMVTTVVLFQGLKASPAQIITVVMAFLVICFGITILQMSKVDPTKLTRLDRKSTILLQAARNNTESVDEKAMLGVEDPGMDAIRGSFGPVGSIIRARTLSRLSQSKGGSKSRSRQAELAPTGPFDGRSWISDGLSTPGTPTHQPIDLLAGMKRHQLWDAPVPEPLSPSLKSPSLTSPGTTAALDSARQPTIKFDNEAKVHSYHPPGTGGDSATHERRSVGGRDESLTPYPLVPLETESTTQGAAPVEEPGSTIDVLNVPLDDKLVRSAPPTVSPRFAAQAYGRPDARDIFVKTQSSSSGTLLSHSPSSGSEEEQSPQLGRKDVKRYPKGVGDDDREESVSLWQGQSMDDDRGDDATPTATGGIRLIQSKPRNPF